MIETIVSSIASCAFTDARTAGALELVRSTSCYLKKIKSKNLYINKIREKKKKRERERKVNKRKVDKRKVDKSIKKYTEQIFLW